MKERQKIDVYLNDGTILHGYAPLTANRNGYKLESIEGNTFCVPVASVLYWRVEGTQ